MAVPHSRYSYPHREDSELSCLVAGPISGLCSRSASDFVKLTGELDAVLRYEVETTAGEEV